MGAVSPISSRVACPTCRLAFGTAICHLRPSNSEFANAVELFSMPQHPAVVSSPLHATSYARACKNYEVS